jgi:hypothetical protein
MILNWFYIILTQLITNFTISLRVSTSFKQSHQRHHHSKIDTSTQGQLPRAASELKCSLASSSRPVLQPPTISKIRYKKGKI